MRTNYPQLIIWAQNHLATDNSGSIDFWWPGGSSNLRSFKSITAHPWNQILEETLLPPTHMHVQATNVTSWTTPREMSCRRRLQPGDEVQYVWLTGCWLVCVLRCAVTLFLSVVSFGVQKTKQPLPKDLASHRFKCNRHRLAKYVITNVNSPNSKRFI